MKFIKNIVKDYYLNLKHDIEILEMRIYVLENPFKFEIGEIVVIYPYGSSDCSNSITGKVLKREWDNQRKKYYILSENGELLIEFENFIIKQTK